MSASYDKVALEVAEAEFQRWAETMDLASKFDVDAMDDEDRKSFLANKRPIIEAMRSGRLVCTAETAELVYEPKFGETTSLKFPEPVGATIMAMDVAGKPHHGVAKTFAVLAALTGVPSQVFGKMKNRDLTVCQSILVFYLAK